MLEESLADAPVETTDQPTAETTEAPAPETTESFTEFDPTDASQMTPEQIAERYKSMQADYTRKTQSHAEAVKAFEEDKALIDALRTDKDTQRAVFQELQELLEQAEENGEELDPRDARIAALESVEQQRQALDLSTKLKTHIETLAKDAKLELDPDDFDDIFRQATASETINPDVTKAAFEKWNKREQSKKDKILKDYLKSKEAPTQMTQGTSATDKEDFSPDARIKRMAARMGG